MTEQLEQKELTEITLDSIRKLRLQGYGYEAKQQHKTYLQKKKEQRQQIERELRKQDREKKKTLGICTIEGCWQPHDKGLVMCKEHREKWNAYKRTYEGKEHVRPKRTTNNTRRLQTRH